ncbi:MAG: hypothetical protein ACRECX_02565 [Methyloceanibacter sp.]|uniref:hypothetical protein n=1 Tax=Methyloceanibacter sp. TaxID=1965321 RepID=UPI003D6CB1E9
MRATLTATGILLIAAALPAAAQVPNKACPPGTLLFGYGDSYGCIKPGTNEVVVKCFRQKTCPSGWTGAGLPDDRGYDLCCVPPAPPPPPKEDSLEEMLNKHHPNRTCMWDGTAPFCDGKCPPDLRDGQYPSKDGKGMPPGFGSKCVSGMKVYCCRFGVY